MAERDWQIIFGAETPVRGEAADVRAAIREFDTRQRDAQSVLSTFRAAGGGNVRSHLEGPPAELLAETIREVGDSLPDLVRVAGEAEAALRRHLASLESLQDEADAAIARARTAYDEREAAEDQVRTLRNQIADLTASIDYAAADDDTSYDESQRDGAYTSLNAQEEVVNARTATLANIYGRSGSDYHDLLDRHEDLQRRTSDELDGIDLGSLKDPGFWERLGSSIAGFVGGIVESLVNFVEALLTGDWATMFWELRNLLNVALMVLGTIALFTGVGAPLFFLAVAALAVTAGLAITQTPNPQTGETLGIGDVALSAVGVAFSAGGAIRAFQAGGKGMQLFTGVEQGAVVSSVRNIRNLATLRGGGTAAVDAAKALNMRNPTNYLAPTNNFGQILKTPSGAWTTARTTWSATGATGRAQNLASVESYIRTGQDASLGPLDHITRTKGHEAITNVAGEPAFDVAHAPDGLAMLDGMSPIDFGQHGAADTQGTPVFGPPATTGQVRDLQAQMASSPDIVVVPAS